MSAGAVPDASLTDHGFEPLSAKGLTYPLGSFAPEYGHVHTIADGVGWTRLHVPGSLKHINVWLMDDGVGVAIVDCGLNLAATHDAWGRALGGRAISRVICTHFHPDHIGAAGWLCDRHGAKLWMNRTEWLMARMLVADVRPAPPTAAIAYYVGAGYTDEQLAPIREGGWGRFSSVVAPLPLGHVRIRDGDVLPIGVRDWTVWIGSGHTPEHVCLVDLDGKLMIAGDQVLPRITSNVSMSMSEPDGDPLGDWLASIDKFRALPADLFVLPAHGEPFHGLHARLDRLEDGHRKSLDRLQAHLAQSPRRAVDCFGPLFKREIDANILGLATGEAMAHLRHLETTGRARRDDRDGVWWFSAT